MTTVPGVGPLYITGSIRFVGIQSTTRRNPMVGRLGLLAVLGTSGTDQDVVGGTESKTSIGGYVLAPGPHLKEVSPSSARISLSDG